jgi:four helix bundle protein
MRNFRTFTIWKQGMDLALEAYRIVNRFPRDELYGLKSQIKRASVSIPSNIAEGCSRWSEREFARYLEIALGSSFEVETDFMLAQKLEWIQEKDLVVFLDALHAEQKQINALLSKLRASTKSRRPYPPGANSQKLTANGQKPTLKHHRPQNNIHPPVHHHPFP